MRLLLFKEINSTLGATNTVIQAISFMLMVGSVCSFALGQASRPPNIVWVVIEDASPNIGCYGETAIATPNLDRFANDGIRFTNAIVSCPVCSPSRSAMVTGMFQTTLGSLHHRSQRKDGKGGGNVDYYSSFRLPVASVPDLFRKAGYYVTNSGKGKQDYNFIAPEKLYDSGSWKDRSSSKQPFFSQIQLAGGKARNAKVLEPVNSEEVVLPPYYPQDDPVLKEDWAQYLNTWLKVDAEIGQIEASLKQSGDFENTVVFVWSDHGVSHLRGKQFLYDEGIRVPLLIRFGDDRIAQRIRTDVVSHIDIAATSLALAEIPQPSYMQGRDLLADDFRPREYVCSARDRCDETVDVIRCVRTKKWKYIRNFMSFVPHAQPNQYKDGKTILKVLRERYAAGELNELQARPFAAQRPHEELYDLENDPFETKNLANEPRQQNRLAEMRNKLKSWMLETRDVGLIPEPILEDIGKAAGSKYEAMLQDNAENLLFDLWELFESARHKDVSRLRALANDEQPALRYWAVTWLGILDDQSTLREIRRISELDDTVAVRIAAALARGRLGDTEDAASLLADLIEDRNLIAGMYAIRGLEKLGPASRTQLSEIQMATKSPYEFTRRYARRLATQLSK